jgi:Polyketide cyclase / dehydrase and lipid transport
LSCYPPHGGRDTHRPVRWRIGSAERTLTEEIPAPPDQVRDFYVDLNNIQRVHPLVVAVHSTGRNQTADGYVQTCRVHDRIPLGPITLRTSYAARLHVSTAGGVVADARQFPRVRLHSTATFDRIQAGTRVVEHLLIEAPRPLAGVTTREADKAHIAMLSGIRRCFEKG